MNILTKAVEMIKQQLPDMQILYVFGSTDTAYEKTDSDLDIAILTPKRLDALFRFQLSEQIAREIHRDVDLIDLFDASTVLRFQIVSTGRRLFCLDKNICDLFEMMVYSMYVRLNDERRDILESIKQRGQILNG